MGLPNKKEKAMSLRAVVGGELSSPAFTSAVLGSPTMTEEGLPPELSSRRRSLLAVQAPINHHQLAW